MSNHPLETRLDIVIRLLENLPRKLFEELERRETDKAFDTLELAIDKNKARMEAEKK